MEYEKIVGKDQLTTWIGVATLISGILYSYGYEVDPKIVVLVLVVAISLLGRLSNENAGKIPVLPGPPEKPTPGQIYYSSQTNRLRIYDGAQWKEISIQSDEPKP